MDPLLSSTSKKYRKEASIDIPIIECKREFTLPHKFPSTVNSSKCSSVLKDHGTIAITNTELQSNLNRVKNRRTLSTNGIRKLRIKTKDGKDLGEVKVQILTQKNLLNIPKITKVQQGRNYVKSNGTTSVTSQNNISALLKPLGPQLHEEAQKSTKGSACYTKPHTQFVVKPVSFSELSTSIKYKMPVTQNKSKNVVQKHYVLAKVNKVDQSNKLLLLNENRHNIFQNIPAVPEKDTEPGKNNIVLVNKQKNAEECIFKNNEKSRGNENNDVPRKTNISNNKSSIIQLAKSKFPVVRCEKLKISPTKVNTNKITVSPEKTKKRKHSNLDGWNHSAKKIIVSNSNSCSPNSSEIQKLTSILKKPANFIPKILDNNKSDDDKDDVMILCEKNTIIGDYYNNTQEKNCTSVLVNNKNVDKKTQGIFIEIGNKPMFCKNKSQNKIRAEETENNEKSGKLSECLNVIKEALISVKDDELRAKALHALAECGIGIAKQVPIIPPEMLRTVHDSQIQTDVFGLLDSESFVLVKENIPTIERIKQTERSTVNLPPVMQEVYTQTERQIQCKPNFTNNINDIDLFPMCIQDTIPLQNTLDFDNCFNELFNNNTDVNRVKEVLSTPHSLCKKVAMQIERDYDEMQHYDDNGMLNIHRAVVNDQLHDVQRLLLVLEASKTSIDVLTEDGRTSLELAIMNEASKDIVKLLLEAGAKPILSELVHDSAVLLACKQSSPFLSYLLSYVTEPELLNREDSTGMAPLHYCALKGNLDGIIALVEMGAEINLKDHRSGRTPFFHALENNHMPVAQKLLECGAMADIVNFSGQSVLCLVDETKSLSFKALIKQIVI